MEAQAATTQPVPEARLGEALFAGRILSFDEKAGLAWAEFMAEGKISGRPRSGLDIIIAAIAAANSCVVVTDNERDFVGVQIVNPRSGARLDERSPSCASR